MELRKENLSTKHKNIVNFIESESVALTDTWKELINKGILNHEICDHINNSVANSYQIITDVICDIINMNRVKIDISIIERMDILELLTPVTFESTINLLNSKIMEIK